LVIKAPINFLFLFSVDTLPNVYMHKMAAEVFRMLPIVYGLDRRLKNGVLFDFEGKRSNDSDTT
jgi:hypothetical protein